MQSLNINQNVKDEIKDAVLNGKEATVSESNIDFNGWNGVGYLIIDPSTGAGAYKISGGSNGGFLKSLKSKAVSFLNLVKNNPAVKKTVYGALAVLLVGVIVMFDKCSGSNLAIAITMLVVSTIMLSIIAYAISTLTAGIGTSFIIPVLIGMYGSAFSSGIKRLCG